MTSNTAPGQLPLLPKPKEDYLDIKSPLFASEPGWGGQLKKWLSRQQARLAHWAARHFASKILPVISIGVLLVGIYRVFSK